MSQTDFAAALLDAQRPVPEGLIGPTGAPAGKRYDVYRNNVAVSLSDALEAAFPAIRKLVGDEFFRAMAGVYLRQHPPRSPLMMHYGQDMPDFLGSFPPVAHLPYLGDVARIELAVRTAYHAADATPVTGETLAAVPQSDLPGLRFVAAPAVQLLASDYPAASIWRANMLGDTVGGAVGSTVGTTVGQSADCALVTRPEFDPVVDALTPQTAAIAKALLSGRTLAHASELGDVGPILGLLLQRQALVAMRPQKENDQ